MPNSTIYCFRANYERSTHLGDRHLPDWLCLEADWQGYKISTVPWVAEVARAIGALEIEDTPSDWISHLESLGFQEVRQVGGEEFFQDRGYS